MMSLLSSMSARHCSITMLLLCIVCIWWILLAGQTWLTRLGWQQPASMGLTCACLSHGSGCMLCPITLLWDLLVQRQRQEP